MWVKRVTRGELLDIMQAERPIELNNIYEFRMGFLKSESFNELQIAWKENPMKQPTLPAAIILRNSIKKDFLAWAITYLTKFRPITAYFRILDTEFIEKSSTENYNPSLGRLEDVCLGLILGEAITYLDGPHIRQLSPNACARTYSFTMSRALSLGLLNTETDAISNAWLIARNLTKQAKLKLDIESLQIPWSVIFSLSKEFLNPIEIKTLSPPKIILDSCRDIFSNGDIREQNWDILIKNYPELQVMREEMYGAREKRVLTLESVCPSLLSSKIGDEITRAFLCGFFASQLAPGTLDHIQLLTSYIRELPTVILWYGLCAGLRSNNNVRNYSLGLGRRVMRDLLREESYLERPRCDIALAELEMLVSDEKSLLEFRTERLGQMEVELAPCVTTIVKWPATSNGKQEILARNGHIFENEDIQKEIEGILHKLNILSRKLLRLNKGQYVKDSEAKQEYKRKQKRKI